MSEHEGSHVERHQEHVPTPEEIRRLFERFTEGKELTEKRILQDAKGIFLWEMIIGNEGNQDGSREISYMRQGDHGKYMQYGESMICVTDYDSEGMPVFSKIVAVYREGIWQDQ